LIGFQVLLSAFQALVFSKAKGFDLLFLCEFAGLDAIAFLLSALATAFEWLGTFLWSGSVEPIDKFERVSHLSSCNYLS
jgi:hypothetical protein